MLKFHNEGVEISPTTVPKFERGLAPDPAVVDTWEGQLQPLTDPSSLTITQFVMVLLIVLIEQMNNVCDVIKDCSYLGYESRFMEPQNHGSEVAHV